MTALHYQSPMTVEEYLALDRNSLETRYEYIDGTITMLAGGSANHSIIKINITGILSRLLARTSCRVYDSDLRVRISETRYVYPDASVSCDPQDRGQNDIMQSPRLVIEVLSPSTERYDRGKKFSYYRACPTIQEYVLIDSQSQEIQIYRREKVRLWTLHIYGPGDEVELNSLNIHFPFAQVYENVELPEEDGPQLA